MIHLLFHVNLPMGLKSINKQKTTKKYPVKRHDN